MMKKISFILLLISFSICLCLMSNTYSRYVADATGDIEVLFAKWQILVNDTDITNQESSSITFTPIVEENENIASNVIAPSSKGYFDIAIDPTNVEVSFKYKIELEMENENIPDLMITKYSIISKSYVEGDHLEIIDLEENAISETLKYNKDIEKFKFESFVIRVYFEWYDGDDELMDDESDSIVGKMAAEENTAIKMKANILFEQAFE